MKVRTSRRQTMISVAFLLGAVCSLAAEKAAFVPGNETDKAIATLNTVLNL